MKRKAIVPNAFTAFSLSCGVFVIFKMTMLAPGAVTYQNVLTCAVILMVAAFLDLLDGAIARAMKAESAFGSLFDSMSDAISFGVAPATLVLKTLSVMPATFLSFLVTMSAMVYAIAGVLRLVRFTVTAQQRPSSHEDEKLQMSNFTGLPITAAAPCAVSATLFLMSEECRSLVVLDLTQRAWIASIVFLTLGYFMVSRWKFPSLKTLHVRVGSFQLLFLTAFFAAVILVGAVHHFPVVFAGVSWAYFFVSIVLSVVRIIGGKKIHVLQDFEPEKEDDND
jgi:CDP-diacylglycerol---serine O-phosphatidyltransferase